VRIDIIRCARCSGDHPQLMTAKLTRPFAPPEANGIEWTHWAPCPSNGEPIMVFIPNESAPGPAYPGSELK
jgi:hypothetical protein